MVVRQRVRWLRGDRRRDWTNRFGCRMPWLFVDDWGGEQGRPFPWIVTAWAGWEYEWVSTNYHSEQGDDDCENLRLVKGAL